MVQTLCEGVVASLTHVQATEHALEQRGSFLPRASGIRLFHCILCLIFSVFLERRVQTLHVSRMVARFCRRAHELWRG